MAGTIINGYEIEGELTTNNSGFSKWGFAQKDQKMYFIKEFLSPVYPEDTSLFSEKQIEAKKKGCKKFEDEKIALYQSINNATDGNSVTIDEFFRHGSKYYAVMEKVTAVNVMPDVTSYIPQTQKLLLCMNLAHSLSCLHEKGIVHGDLKWTNILFTQSKNKAYLTTKLIDFDNSFFINKPPKNYADFNVDQIYCAPETQLFLEEEPIELDDKIDVFALGIIFHQILTETIPAFSSDYNYLYEALLDDSKVTLSVKLDQNLNSLIQKMIAPDPVKRPAMSEVLSELMTIVPWSNKLKENSKITINNTEEESISSFGSEAVTADVVTVIKTEATLEVTAKEEVPVEPPKITEANDNSKEQPKSYFSALGDL